MGMFNNNDLDSMVQTSFQLLDDGFNMMKLMHLENLIRNIEQCPIPVTKNQLLNLKRNSLMLSMIGKTITEPSTRLMFLLTNVMESENPETGIQETETLRIRIDAFSKTMIDFLQTSIQLMEEMDPPKKPKFDFGFGGLNEEPDPEPDQKRNPWEHPGPNRFKLD